MAQTLNSAYFTEGYNYRHTMNPAYGNDEGYSAIPVLGNLNVKVQGNFGVRDVLFKSGEYGINTGKSLVTFMHPGIPTGDALGGLSSGNNRVVGDINIPIVSVGFKGFGGYNTVELNTKVAFGTSIPYEFFEFARNTGNNTYDIGDINANAQAYVELAFGHSRQLDEKWRVGAKFKLLFGGGRADAKFEGEHLDGFKDTPLFLYTDGLNEAENPEHEIFGSDRLLAVLSEPYTDAETAIKRMQTAIAEHVAGADASDDLTMLCLEIKNNKSD